VNAERFGQIQVAAGRRTVKSIFGSQMCSGYDDDRHLPLCFSYVLANMETVNNRKIHIQDNQVVSVG